MDIFLRWRQEDSWGVGVMVYFYYFCGVLPLVKWGSYLMVGSIGYQILGKQASPLNVLPYRKIFHEHLQWCPPPWCRTMHGVTIYFWSAVITSTSAQNMHTPSLTCITCACWTRVCMLTSYLGHSSSFVCAGRNIIGCFCLAANSNRNLASAVRCHAMPMLLNYSELQFVSCSSLVVWKFQDQQVVLK